jgi:hypothetical protein
VPSHERLRALQRLADRYASRAGVGPRLAHYASIAGRYVPAQPRKPLLDMSFTLVQPPAKR